MKIVFIADGHLKGLEDPGQKALVEFLDGLSTDVLVILGDLFDFWTGFNEVVYYHYLPVLNALLKLKEKGTRIIYLEGNHDFSMGRFFTGILKAEVYPDSFVFSADGKKFYLSHGDSIDGGLSHRAWRSFLRTPVFRAISRAAGPQVVWKVAMRLSRKSREYNRGADSLEGKLKAFAKKMMAEGVDNVVLGHSHRASVNREEGSKGGFYANPGSWAGERSYLVYSDGRFKVEKWRG